MVEASWEYFKEIEPNLGLVSVFRSKMSKLQENSIQITFEVLENLAELESVNQ